MGTHNSINFTTYQIDKIRVERDIDIGIGIRNYLSDVLTLDKLLIDNYDSTHAVLIIRVLLNFVMPMFTALLYDKDDGSLYYRRNAHIYLLINRLEDHYFQYSPCKLA